MAGGWPGLEQREAPAAHTPSASLRRGFALPSPGHPSRTHTKSWASGIGKSLAVHFRTAAHFAFDLSAGGGGAVATSASGGRPVAAVSAAGGTASEAVTVEVQPGTYRMWCTIGHHAEHGMTTEITVE